MASPFTAAARVALEEMVRKHVKSSKFGYFMTEDDLEQLVEELLSFIEMSRNLRTQGDKFLKNGAIAAKPKPSSNKELR